MTVLGTGELSPLPVLGSILTLEVTWNWSTEATVICE